MVLRQQPEAIARVWICICEGNANEVHTRQAAPVPSVSGIVREWVGQVMGKRGIIHLPVDLNLHEHTRQPLPSSSIGAWTKRTHH